MSKTEQRGLDKEMWDKDTTFLGCPEFLKRWRELTEKVIAEFPVLPKGVLFVLDQEDDRRLGSTSVFQKKLGLFQNIRSRPIEGPIPRSLICIRQHNDFHYLIWLSRRACVTTDIHFAWVLAHEITHLLQELQSEWLPKAGDFLAHTIGKILGKTEVIATEVPTELDAELSSWRTVCKIFGKGQADSYLEAKAACEENRDYFERLKAFDPESPPDVRECIIRILRNHKGELNSAKTQYNNPHIRDFDIDQCIDELSKR